ncbi:MAG: S-adenosylmethionine:tRNA ribosyltransferase-isomerase, partial [Flavobacteriales bacterium]
RTLESLYWLALALKNGRTEFVVNQWDPYELKDSFETYNSALEYLLDLKLAKISAVTSIMITPSYRIKSVDALITNFHLPKSTLLLLVSSAIGENWKVVYNHALENGYRFLSFGDSSFLTIRK